MSKIKKTSVHGESKCKISTAQDKIAMDMRANRNNQAKTENRNLYRRETAEKSQNVGRRAGPGTS
jgi:hypothetical protein